MKVERDAYIEALRQIDFDPVGREKSKEDIDGSDILAHGKTIPFSYVPLFVNDEDHRHFNDIIGQVQTILAKITQHYIDDPSYRPIFGFSKAMEELICLPCYYEEMIPVGRYDIFYDEESGNYQFCEFNTDGSGGMSRDWEMSTAILKHCQAEAFFKNYHAEPFPTIEAIADELIRIYHSDKNVVISGKKTCICVTDFREEGVFSDFERFIKVFEARGFEAGFTDIRDLVFDGEHLIDKTNGQVIDAIYRRAVTSVVLPRIEECRGLVEALKAGKVVLMGHFRTSVAHSKMINVAMYHPKTWEFMTDEEIAYIKAHMPETYSLDASGISAEKIEEIRCHKDAWILKPDEGFGSHDVYSGLDHTEEEWSGLINRAMNNHFIIQKFCPRYSMPFLGPDDREVHAYPLMLGIYQAGGKAVGYYSRAGHAGVIDFNHGGICVSTLHVMERPLY